jgi:hypothetical protein
VNGSLGWGRGEERAAGRQAGRQASRLEEKGGVGWALSFVRLAKTLPCLTSKLFFGGWI